MTGFTPIAIVGQACLLPGARSPAELWNLCLEKRCALSPSRPGRWRAGLQRVMAPFLRPGEGPAVWPDRAGYVDDDAGRMGNAAGMAPELAGLDPLVHWLIRTGREALHGVKRDARSRAGAVIGNLSLPSDGFSRFSEMVWGRQPELAALAADRFMSGLPGHMLAATLQLDGGCVTIDAACASSLYAIKLACDELHAGRCDLMLAGAVSRVDPLFLHIGFAALQALSPTASSRPFHQQADGLVPAEGAAMVALKRLDDAVSCGDAILGVIRGVGLANDGRASGLLVPAAAGQVRAMLAAYAQSGLNPSDIGLIECHATGTPLGDRTEIASLSQVFPGYGRFPCASLKGNLGHTITTSGMAALIKVVQSLAADIWAPSLGAEAPLAELDASPLRLLHEAEPWQGPRRAAINAFGFGGNNAHLIVERYERRRATAGVREKLLAGAQTGALDVLSTANANVARATPESALAVVAMSVVAAGGSGLADFAAKLYAENTAAAPGEGDYAAAPQGEAAFAASTIRLPYRDLRSPPKDLQQALPQQTLLLQAALQAMAQLPELTASQRNRAAVLIGMGCHPDVASYGDQARHTHGGERPDLTAAMVLGCLPNIVANRLNAQFDFGGPSYAVSAEEASGLAALRLAGAALNKHEIDLALVGAVDLACNDVQICAASACLAEALAPAGDGAVVLAVMRQADARAQGLPVLALLPAITTMQAASKASDGQDTATADLAAAAAWPTLGLAPGALALTQLFGHAHAASGLLHAAAAIVAVATRRRPQLEGLPPAQAPAFAQKTPCPQVQVRVQALGGAELAVVIRGSETAAAAFAHCLSSEERGRRQPALQLPVAAKLATMVGLPDGRLGPDWAELGPEPLAASFCGILESNAAAHAAYLEAMACQTSVHAAYLRAATAALPPPVTTVEQGRAPSAAVSDEAPLFSRAALEHLATGRISEVFGREFSEQDAYERQVRMPMPPLLLADRVLAIAAPPQVLGKGTIWTATDIVDDAWYLHEGHIPAGILIEAGQADLLLISWMGIDAFNRGERVYRLLGCDLTYHGPLPKVGDTLTYAIHIDGHAQHGAVRLFFFHYDCWAGDRLCLSVRQGQAGFFTDAELADSAGILWDAAATPGVAGATVCAPLVHPKARFTRAEVDAFAAGDPAGCFGVDAAYDLLQTHTATPRIQAGAMQLMGAVTALEVNGGPWQRGYLRSQLELTATDWFFAGHFHNDPCMPGTLMFEGCLQGMAFYLAALGFTLARDGWRWQPVSGESYPLRCRGQVLPSSRTLVYELFVQELRLDPYPTLYADLLCTVDGVKAFHAHRVGLQLVPGVPMDRLAQLPAAASPLVASEGSTLFDERAMLAAAWDRPGAAFGPRFDAVPDGRHLPHLPGPPLHFMSRVSAVALGPTRPGSTAQVVGSSVEVAYDVPSDAWYFAAHANGLMPFAVLLEIALQPCGWLACYSGVTLDSTEDLYFRNLDGTGAVCAQLAADCGTIHTQVKLTSLSRSGGMILVSFAVQCFNAQGLVFRTDTKFGFFQKPALAAQAGIVPSPLAIALAERPSNTLVELRSADATTRARGLQLPSPMLLMLDRIDGWWPEAGSAGLGQVRGSKDVAASDWFFKAHFYQDPVQPGSLGLEAMLQLLQYYVGRRNLGAVLGSTGGPVTWKYRGQVLPRHRQVKVAVEITKLLHVAEQRRTVLTADGFLWCDGQLIYTACGLSVEVSARG